MRNHVPQAVLATGLLLLWIGSAPAAPMVRPPDPPPGCPVCALWEEYERDILLAKQEIGELPDGIVCFYHASNPDIIESLIRFAYARRALEEGIEQDEVLRETLGDPCGHFRSSSAPVRLEITPSARGFFAIITSPDSYTVKVLKNQGSLAIRTRLPVWF